jgi:hypothetical protein
LIALQYRSDVDKRYQETQQAVSEKVPPVPVVKGKLAKHQSVKQVHDGKADKQLEQVLY